ncbi:MAG TPA: hypothetical protein VGM01_04035, partial [Ktedonobacteraceae bacterium]
MRQDKHSPTYFDAHKTRALSSDKLHVQVGTTFAHQNRNVFLISLTVKHTDFIFVDRGSKHIFLQVYGESDVLEG